MLHIDPTGAADPLPFGIRAPPFVVVRVQPMAGELSRYTVSSNDPNDEPEEDIVQTGRIPDRIVQTSQFSHLPRVYSCYLPIGVHLSSSIWSIQVQDRKHIYARNTYCLIPIPRSPILPRCSNSKLIRCTPWFIQG